MFILRCKYTHKRRVWNHSDTPVALCDFQRYLQIKTYPEHSGKQTLNYQIFIN